MARAAEELHAEGVRLVNEGHLLSAKRVLVSAQKATSDVNLSARILGTLGYALALSGDPAEGERLCRQALGRPGIDDRTFAILAGQIGSLAERAGRLDEADRWLTRAIDALDDESEELAMLSMNRSLLAMQRRQFQSAASDARAASRIFGERGARVRAAQARHNEGYLALLQGDLVTALATMGEARPVLAGVSPAAAVTSDMDRAEVLRDAGLVSEAERLLTHAAEVFGAQHMPRGRAEAELHLALSQLNHDPIAASRTAAAAARTFQRINNEAWAARSVAVRMRAGLSGGAYTRTGDRFADPRRVPMPAEVEALAADLDRYRFRSEAAALRMSLELWRSRHGAVHQATRVIRPPASASMEVRLLAHAVRAERAAARGRQAEARRHAARGLDTLSTWQREFGSLDLQTSIAMHGDALVGAGLRSAVASGRPDVIFEWSERARHLMLQVVPLRPPPDPSLAAELAELRTLRIEKGGDWLADPRAAELQQRARDRQWSATRSAAFEERASLTELGGVLESDTALISYVFSGERLTALVVTAARALLLPIDSWPEIRRALPGLRADLDMAASVRAGPMADIVRKSLQDRLARLSKALLDQPVDASGSRRLVITVPGVLNGIPWAMLPAMRGRPFTVASSASRWVRQRGIDASAGSAAIYPRAGFAVGPRVARGDEEAESAAAAWRTPRVLRHPTVDDVADLAVDVDVLHIAAHGRHAADNPMFSGLELADGALFGYDIDRIAHVPDTVVLSACEAGRSSVRWGEEAVGMTRIWLHAGTRSVIAAPVVVADDDACELLAAVHVGLAAGQVPAEALAEASVRTGIVAPFQTHGAGF